MKLIPPILLLLLFALVTGFDSHPDKISGSYKHYTGYEYHYVHLKRNHSYYKESRGCTYGSATKGNWYQSNDTLVLKRTHYKSTRKNGSFESSILLTEQYLVRKDSLIELYKTDSGQIVRRDILIRK